MRRGGRVTIGAEPVLAAREVVSGDHETGCLFLGIPVYDLPRYSPYQSAEVKRPKLSKNDETVKEPPVVVIPDNMWLVDREMPSECDPNLPFIPFVELRKMTTIFAPPKGWAW